MALVTLALAASAGSDWPQFRGPTGDGLATATNLPLVWSATQNVTWKTTVPGKGRSSPIVLGDSIWLTTANATGLRTFTDGPSQMEQANQVGFALVCLDAAHGRQRYLVEVCSATNPPPINTLNSYATPTPVAESGRVYCDFGTFGTFGIDARDGHVLWSRQFPLDHAHGPGSSPVLHGNALVLVRDGRDQQYVVALDKRTGNTLWKVNRPPLDTPVPEFRKAFSTPLVVSIDGRTQLLSAGAQWLVAYDLDSGREFWRVNHLKGESGAPRPVFGAGVVYFSTGVIDGRPQLWAVRADGTGDVTSSNVLWKLTSHLGFMPSPLLVGSALYLLSDDGFLTCVEAATGKTLNKVRLGGNFAASPLYAEGRIYCFGRDGRTVVLKSEPALTTLAENQLEGPVFASPACVDAALLVRTDTHLYRLGPESEPRRP